MSQRLDLEAVEKAFTSAGAEAWHTLPESVPLLIARVRELEPAEAAAHSVGEIFGPYEWATWADLETLAASKMKRIRELEAEITRLKALSESQEEQKEAK